MNDIIQQLIDIEALSVDLKMSKKSIGLILQHPLLVSNIISASDFIIGDFKSTIRERIYVIKNNISTLPKCLVCNKPVLFRKTSIKVGYPDTCSIECGGKSPLKQTRRSTTSNIKYGTNLPQQSDIVKEKAKNTNLMRYNREHKNQTQIPIDYFTKLQSKDWFIEQHHTNKRTLSELATELSVNVTTIQRHLHLHDLDTKYFYTSNPEKQISEELVKCGIVIEQNNRSIISPYELDIFLPEYNIAIEYCGLYWHSEQQGKNKWYHKNKMVMCNGVGIRLITVFSDEWEHNSTLVMNTIKNIIQINTTHTIFARKCVVGIVDLKTKTQFFNDNHIQGNGPSSINLGLFYDNTLVACMGFIKQLNDKYVLNRYTTSCNVPGGFSKLLNYFKNNYQWNEIISFADLRWSQGDLYKTNGFVLDKILPPDYYYSTNGHVREHKFNFRRKYLEQRLDKFDPLLSERDNCNNANILRIWDCGKLRYTMIRG